MVSHEVERYTPHEHHPCDRIFSRKAKNGFYSFSPFYLAKWFPLLLNPHQLPKETMWIAWNYFVVPPYMRTSPTLVTENLTGKGFQKILHFANILF